MSDFNIRGKLPFNVVSSSVNTGYAAGLSASVQQNIAIVNHHRDDYGELEGTPLQGPFTQQHVGGNQHRHIELNLGNDNVTNRPEAYIISSSVNSIKIYGPDINDINNPRAIYTRGLVAKSPLNISNIQTSGNVVGNFEHNYQVVQAVGRSKINNLIVDGFEASGVLTTKFVTGSHQVYTLPNITGNSKSIFVERFNAPGGKEESSRGALDREGEECAPNNSLVTRNIKIRQPFYKQLTQHAAQFNSGSVEGITIHTVNRNSINRLELNSLNNPVSSSRSDNFWIQHAIPSTDLRYAWISSSKQNNTLFQYQQTNNVYNIENKNNIINFASASGFGDFIGISGAVDKNDIFISNYTNTMYRDNQVLSFRNISTQYIDLSEISPDITNKNFTISFWGKYRQKSLPSFFDYGFANILNISGTLGIISMNYANSADSYNYSSLSNSFIINVPSGTSIKTTKTQRVKIWDQKWHLITISRNIDKNIKTLNKKQTKEAIETITYNVYVDGGLIYSVTLKNLKPDISSIKFYNFYGSERGREFYDIRLLGDMFVWDTELSPEQINKFYLLSKNNYGDKPKKYIQYKDDKLNTSKPLHAFSSRINAEQNLLYNEEGNKNAKLNNFIISQDIQPSLNKKISYSTYFNGPYQGAGWKFLKNKEHPVTRKLTTENTNIISVVIPETPKQILKTIKGQNVAIYLPAQRKQGKLLNLKEPPVTVSNKPLQHTILLKDKLNSTNIYQITHTYTNNLEYFTNKNIDSVIGLKNETPTTYDRIYDFYANSDLDDNENPFQKVFAYSYSETIFPQRKEAFLKETRGRTDYINDEPGYGFNGYEKQLGTQRTFWRDNPINRYRSQDDYINSFGHQIPTASYNTVSIRGVEYIETSSYISDYAQILPLSVREYYEIKTLNCGELFNFNIYSLNQATNVNALRYDWPIQHIPEIYYYKNNTTIRTQYNPYLDLSGNVEDYSDLTSYKVQPGYIYQHFNTGFMFSEQQKNYILSSSLDLGLNRYTEILSGKNPWYDNYENYSEDFRGYGKSYSIIPEFNISNNINNIVKLDGGDFRKYKIENYISDVSIDFKDSLEKQNSKFFKQDKITLNISGIKKLLPYNGFYPIDRSIQLVNYLKDSYIDTEAVIGGLLLSQSTQIPPVITASYYDSLQKTSSYTLERFCKESAFLEPLYSPGIFYNLIKSGIAVNWSTYTNIIPYVTANPALSALSIVPSYKIPFETIIDPLFGFPVKKDNNPENRILKIKELSLENLATDYGFANIYFEFQSFFEIQRKSNPLYSLSINNFLAETINFFLKDSSLNTFISAPENQFKIMDKNKTYYMDIVLRKTDNFKMIDAYSSSISLYHGNMTGRYFGPSFWTGSVSERATFNSTNLNIVLKDPGYSIYTPPYFYGESIARLSFKPTVTRKYNLSEILAACQTNIVYLNNGLNNINYSSGSLYEPLAMNVGDSVNIFGILEDKAFISRPSGRPGTNAYSIQDISNKTDTYKWVISSKMEVPTLNFINQEYTSNNTFLPITQIDQFIKTQFTNYVYPTASGFGIGMWSGYGEIPKDNEGIFLDLRESFPEKSYEFNRIDIGSNVFVNSTTGSLIDVCGFQKDSKRIGEIADQKVISEAILIIPYSTTEIKRPRVTRKGGQTIAYGMTTKIENFNLFRISDQIYNKQKLNVDSGKPAVVTGDFGSSIDIQDTSISTMIEAMKKYVIPPNFNFLEYSDIKPFVMYIAEFESTLNKQDLADIWQGVMPSIATKAELDEAVISHTNNIHEFFHGAGLPENVKFLIFKVKKKAEINYYKMTAQSTDDNLFKFDFKVGKKAPEYSYNWPYDYCSLVEMAKIDIKLDYSSKDETLKLEQQGINVSSSLSSNVSVATRGFRR